MMKVMKKSKKGVTLVESVFAVVILGLISIGIISMLSTGSTKIFELSNESNAHAQAVQKLDLAISAISNGSTSYITSNPTVSLDIQELKKTIFPDDHNKIELSAEIVLYEAGEATVANCRGWYLTLTYHGATVKGFVSNSEGVFDRE